MVSRLGENKPVSNSSAVVSKEIRGGLLDFNLVKWIFNEIMIFSFHLHALKENYDTVEITSCFLYFIDCKLIVKVETISSSTTYMTIRLFLKEGTNLDAFLCTVKEDIERFEQFTGYKVTLRVKDKNFSAVGFICVLNPILDIL